AGRNHGGPQTTTSGGGLQPMALTAHSGTAAIDLNNSAAYRQDISEVVVVSLTPQNNFAGMFQIGAEFAGPQLWWNEDALNQYKVTCDTAASLASTATTINFAQSDAAVLKNGYVLMLDSQVGASSQESMMITAVNGTAITVTRAFSGTAQTYPQNSVFRIVNAPVNPNSDLGPDLTRQRLVKTNYVNRVRFDTNIDSEQILRTHQGYVPGIVDELGYQFQQRLAELLRLINNAMLYSYANASGSPTNDFQTTNGVVAWLDTTANSTASPITTAEPFNDNVLNTMITNIK